MRRALCDSGLPPSGARAACQRLTLGRGRKRQLLFVEGNQAGGVYVIRRGHVKLSRHVGHSEERIVGLLGVGDLFGLASVFNGKHEATAELLTDGELCCGSKETIERLDAEVPGFGLSLARYVYRQLEDARARIAWMGAIGARARLAAYLIHHTDHDDPTSVPHHLTQQELGALLGMSSETVCRTLAAFRKRGLIETKPGSIRILDSDVLRVVACL